jgi:hypothetical protein
MKTKRMIHCGLVAALLALAALHGAACGADAGAEADETDGLGPDGPVNIKQHDYRTGLDQESDVKSDLAPDLPDIREPEEVVNGFNYPCQPMTVEACVTACGSAGKKKCLKEWGPCIPPAEFCGNCADDDCNGLINEGCPPNPECDEPVEPKCPVAIIAIAEGIEVWNTDNLHLSAAQSYSTQGAITKWLWSVEAPAGSAAQFKPSNAVEAPTFQLDVAGQYLFSLDVWDEKGNQSCVPAQVAVNVKTYPPVTPEVGCADGTREGFVDDKAYPHVAGCSGAWEIPGLTPDEVVQTCGGKGGNSGLKPEGEGCSAPDLCAAGWHVCKTYHELAEKSPTGCAEAVPPEAKPKSLFFALRQPSENGSVCGDWGDGFNDVFGCGNLGAGLGPDKKCGPLDRVLASTQPNTCGFNEAEPNLGPWQCLGGQDSHLNEGKLVTKKGCKGNSCQYDGYPVGSSDKGGVLCCRD